MQTVPRLIERFVPEHYNLSLTLDRVGRSFKGVVTINGALLPGNHEVILHSKELVIDAITVDGKAADFTLNDSDELHISQDKLAAGAHVIVITYSGTITDAMHGMYPCYYQHDGVKKELLATQFESHHAREVFPCIDEPEAKAEFDVTLTTEQDITVLGNMPVRSQQVENNQLVTTFETSPRMSTYLLAWVTGELHRATASTKRGVEVNVWATPAQPASSLGFALDIAVRSIEFYEQYFGTDYPLPKSDHVALPDFSSGAMENWGLITYRETTLLANPKTTAISTRQYIASVVVHELAHQWFGNLVTMKWWNNLWLNESFATLMQYISIDALEPDWNVWLDFTQEENILALRRDSIDGVQSVQTDVNHPDEINTLFDGAIVYAKGARLLHMLQHYVGDEAFQAGLKVYFKDFAYTNTEANDLWKAIQSASGGKSIVGLMNIWISEPGYPVLHVSQAGQTVTLLQEQFFVGPHEPSNRKWPIPLNSSSTDMPDLMTEKEIVVTRHDKSPLRFNVGDSAHFITHYDDVLFGRLVDEVKAETFSIIDRVQLLHEATLLARGGMLSSAQLISLLNAYKNETTEQVWTIMSLALSELKKFVEDDKTAEKKLRELSTALALKQYKRLGWNAKPGESEQDTKLRVTILGMMLYGEDPEVIKKAQMLYAKGNIEKLDPELRPLILSTVVRYGDGATVDTLLARYQTSHSGELRDDITYGVTSTRHKKKITELLRLIKNSEVIRPQDAARWFVYLVRGRESKTQAWRWIRDNWPWIEDTFGGDKSYDAYPRYSASALTTRAQLAEYTNFFTPKRDVVALTRSIDMGISEIEGRVDLIERDGPAVRDALSKL